MSTLLRTLITLTVVALAAAAGWWLWQYYLYTPWTRDGRVRANIVTVAPDVAGRVTALRVEDSQHVARGDTLFRIDPKRYQARVAKAKAVMEQRQAELELARHEASRRSRLGRGAISAENREMSRINSRVAAATLAQAQSALDSARLDLARTRVTAPVAGNVLNLAFSEGNYARAGQPALALVEAGSWYVTGYFEETKLAGVQPGDSARIKLMSAEHELTGHVASIGRAIADPNTAPNEQLLPKVQPTFSWVRLAQRIPVRIALDTVPDGVTLSAGMTASVHIEPDA
ncbi:HlyD family secretion protein [Halomonas cibimaris]|uniref:HlyD family secretion protein n=1 Tax=Halomonas cibimaris TaxID=657012 RepID=A0ABP7LL91_9GAMM